MSRITLLCVFFLAAFASLGIAQDFDFHILVSDSVNSQDLVIGVDPNGTDNFDTGLDCYAPPPPPLGAFGAWMIAPNGLDFLFCDIRDNSITQKTFRLQYQAESGQDPIVLTWDNTIIPSLGTFIITDDINGQLFQMSMDTTNMLVVTDPLILNGLRVLVTPLPPQPNQPPVISDITRADFVPAANTDATVTAVITDDHAVTAARLLWTIDGANLDSVAMTVVSGDTFSAAIPASANQNNNRIDYFVRAVDDSGAVTTSASTGYFAGVTNVATVRFNDANGNNLYNGYPVRMTGIATVGTGVFQTSNRDFFIQDTTGGINIFEFGTTDNPDVNQGDSLVAEGTLAQYNGKLEITDPGLSYSILSSGNPLPDPLVVDVTEVDEAHEGLLIKLVDVHKKSGTWPNPGSNGTIYLTSNDIDSVMMFIDKDTDVDDMPEPPYPIDVVGIASQYDNSDPRTEGYEIVPRASTDIIIPPPPPLNPPLNLQALAGDAQVDLSWLPPLPPGEIGYDDGTSETGFGFLNTGEFAVRFTPPTYPVTLVGIKTYWANITNPLDNVEYSVWVNTAGGDNPPATQVVPNTAYTVTTRGDFSVVDISGFNVTVDQGDFFFSWIQPDTINYGIGLDRNSYNYSRSWLSVDGGLSWFKIQDFGFPDNLMIRALVQVGTGKDARIVELTPQPVATPIHRNVKVEDMKRLRSLGNMVELADQQPGVLNSQGNGNTLRLDIETPAGTPYNNPLIGLMSYNIWRSTDSLTFNMIANVDTLTLTYTDNNVTNGTTYYYYVTAVYDVGESGPSNVAVATPQSGGPEPLMSLTHTPGDLNVGIFNDGSIGAENVSFTGPGVTWKGQNGLFVGGLIFGTAGMGSVNGLIGSFGVNGDILNVTSDFASGFTSEPPNFDQVTEAILSDAGAPSPYGVEIIQRTYSNTGEEYVFIRYGFVNTTGATLTDFYSGIFIDWDVDAATYNTNQGGYELDRNLVYQFDTSGTPYYYGIAVLDGLVGYKTTPSSPTPDARSGSFTWISTPDTDPIAPPGDFRSWQGVGPVNIAPGDTAWFTYAVVAGDDLDNIRQNALEAAIKAYNMGWTPPVGIDDEQEEQLPTEFALYQNYPNPFNPSTTIKYALKENADVVLKIYNILGQEVRTLVNAKQTPGFKTVVWDGRDNNGLPVASGVYIYRIQANDFVRNMKMVLMK